MLRIDCERPSRGRASGRSAGPGVDVARDHREIAARLRRKTLALLARERTTAVGELGSEEETEELLDNLRALGYLGDEEE